MSAVPTSYGDFSAPPTDLSPLASQGIFMAMGFIWLIFIAIYIWSAICYMQMAKKAGTPNAWFAWIPILNIILLLQIVRRPLWWIILMLIPFVNIVIAIMLMLDLLKLFGKPAWWIILMIISPINLIIFGVLAFGEAQANPAALGRATA